MISILNVFLEIIEFHRYEIEIFKKILISVGQKIYLRKLFNFWIIEFRGELKFKKMQNKIFVTTLNSNWIM